MSKFKEKIKKFLIWSQKYTHTDMVYLSKNSFWLILGQFLNSISGLILTIILTNSLSKTDYGIYKYLISILNLFLIFNLPGINTAVIQSIARGYENIINKALKTKIKYSFLGSVVSLTISFYYYLQRNQQLSFGLLFVAFFLPIINNFLISESLLAGKKKFKKITQYQITKNLIKTIILIITVLITKNILVIFLIFILINSLLNYIFYKLILKKNKTNKKIDNDVIKYGKKLTIIKLLRLITNQLDKILIFHFLGAQELAVYFIATSFPEQIKAVFKNLTILSLPKFSNKNLQNIKKTLHKKIILSIFVLTSISIIYIIIAPYLYKIFFPKYHQVVFYSQIFILNIIVTPLTLTILNLLQAQKKTKKYFIFQIISSFIQTTALSIGIKYNIIGIIVSRILSQTFNLILVLFLI